MAAPTTWDELKTAIATWAHRDDLDDMAAEFIATAEARFNRTLRLPEMEEDVTTPVSTGSVTLPTDFLEARSVAIDGSSDIDLEFMSLSDLRTFYPTSAGGTPRHFSFQSGDELILRPIPSEECTVLLNYYAKIPALSADNTTNWLLTAQPDLYLAASMEEAMTFARDEGGLAIWAGRAAQKLVELDRQGRKKAVSGAPLRARSAVAQVSRWAKA